MDWFFDIHSCQVFLMGLGMGLLLSLFYDKSEAIEE